MVLRFGKLRQAHSYLLSLQGPKLHCADLGISQVADGANIVSCHSLWDSKTCSNLITTQYPSPHFPKYICNLPLLF